MFQDMQDMFKPQPETPLMSRCHAVASAHLEKLERTASSEPQLPGSFHRVNKLLRGLNLQRAPQCMTAETRLACGVRTRVFTK